MYSVRTEEGMASEIPTVHTISSHDLAREIHEYQVDTHTHTVDLLFTGFHVSLFLPLPHPPPNRVQYFY